MKTLSAAILALVVGFLASEGAHHALSPAGPCEYTCQWNTYTDATGAVTWPECDPVLTCEGDVK